MVEIEIINERSLTLTEMKNYLDNMKKRDKELNFRAAKVKDYLDQFAKLSLKDVESLRKKLGDLNVSRLKDRHIVKIIDIIPPDLDSLKILFAGENLTLKQEELEKLSAVIKEFSK